MMLSNNNGMLPDYIFDKIKFKVLESLTMDNIEAFLLFYGNNNYNTEDVREEVRSLIRDLETMEKYELCGYLKAKYFDERN